jgi:hypothetical protein
MMNWKGFGSKWLWPNSSYSTNIWLERLKVTMRNLSHNNDCVGSDSN